MKRLYTAYLTYPDDLDKAIRNEYDAVSRQWENKRKFEFKPMIPLWKVLLSEKYESDLIEKINYIQLGKLHNLKTKGFETRTDTGYIFLVFDETSSNLLHKISNDLSQVMHIGDAEDFMPHGFESHTSLIKQDPSHISAICRTLTHNLDNVVFTPHELVVSKEIKTDTDISFETIIKINC